jgi:hypothetical protein
MSAIATYGAVYLPGRNDASKFASDADGYYKMVLGGFNVSNGNGIYYPMTNSVKQLFEPGGLLRRRLDGGLCRSEWGHPKLDGLDYEQRLARLARLDPDRVCNHIRDITLEEAKDENGKDIILAVGSIRPSGPFGEILEKQLKNLYENVAYSIRSFATNGTFQGKQARLVTDAITYDYVPEGGIKDAHQFRVASLEELGFTNFEFDSHVSGLESGTNNLTMVKSSLGWKAVPVETINILKTKW